MEDFLAEIKKRANKVENYINNSDFVQNIAPDYLKAGVMLYPSHAGKMLRPAIVMLACEAVGGNCGLVVPAAAAMEISHIWTLVHDDIIDNDDLRRGTLSVHAYYRNKFKHQINDKKKLEEFSRNIAILVGDLQQAWATNIFNNLSKTLDVTLFNYLLNELTAGWIVKVAEGEATDVEYALKKFENIDDTMILNMILKKTASTFAFAGKMGALIGLNKLDLNHNLVVAIEDVCLNAGMAFQLRDDILGIMGNEKQLGKPIGSDIKEGKRTLIMTHAYNKADESQKQLISNVLGNPLATDEEIDKIRNLTQDLGSIRHVENLADEYITKSKLALTKLPNSNAKNLFKQWIDFMINRTK